MTKPNPLPPLEELNRRYYVDPTSPSGLRNKISICSRAQANEVAGTLGPGHRYWNIGIKGKQYAAHRIIYALIHKCDPGCNDVDHCDGDSLNNSPDNLRMVSHSTNLHNTGPRRNNKLGVKGVMYVSHLKKSPYRATIRHKGKRISLGCYPTLEEAKAARDQAEFDLGVHAGF